jgi:hypothetical protein
VNRLYATLLLVITLCVHAAWAEERLKLGKTTILGNGELPRVTFVEPWRNIPSTIPKSQLLPAPRPHPVPLDHELYQQRMEYLRQLKHGREDTAPR